MTTLTYSHSYDAASQHLSVFGRLTVPVAKLVAAWQRRKTERMLEGLPQEIRKDIGWPTTISK